MNNNSNLVRLNKLISSLGYCSRRKADEFISNGKVKVDNQIVNDLGISVSINSKIEVNGSLLTKPKLIYILFNKPKNTITSNSDDRNRKTVIDYIKTDERVFPIGRLDRNTTGVLLLTNDGNLTNKLLHPSSNISKIYHVELNKTLTVSDKSKLVHGIELEDGISSFDKITQIFNSNVYEVTIHSGKNRIIRRMFNHLDYNVLSLDRVSFASIRYDNLRCGQFRFLNSSEVKNLYEIISTH